MLEFIALFLISCASIIGCACAINYFWRIGPWRSLGFGAFIVCAFLVFWASGLWEGAQRHDWGVLTPAFFLIILAVGAAAGVLCLLARHYLAKKRKC